MKTPEDEAFDDLAQRQGDWGGGYQAKRQMAADKMQDESDMLTIAYLHGYDKGKKAALAQPAQEPFGHWHWEQPMTKPLQGWFVKGPSDGKLNGVSGIALYTAPPQREWVGLTVQERNDCLVQADPCECLADPEAHQLMVEVEAKLKEKNNAT